MTHSFTLTVLGLDYDQAEKRFYEAGCDDALLSMSNGVMTLDFDREVPDFLAALNSALEDVARAGAQVRRVEPIREREPA